MKNKNYLMGETIKRAMRIARKELKKARGKYEKTTINNN